MRTHAGLLLILSLLAGCSRKDPEERAMTPRDSLQAMHFSEDFHAELFASEPDVMSPVEMAFDENGKVYVAEMMDYPEDPPAGKPDRSRIRVLENLNRDGKTWRSSIFAENVLAVSGFMPWKGGLIVTSAPDILLIASESLAAIGGIDRLVICGIAGSIGGSIENIVVSGLTDIGDRGGVTRRPRPGQRPGGGLRCQ